MGVVDTLDHGKPITEPVQYIQGAVNGIAALTEALLDVGVALPLNLIEGFDHEAINREIERISR